ncbi:MAG: hypothetical protein N4A63_12095 [Vallitalea sp.]|jgi:hypothetical protein|nr:hypothetical protein [Vallitalea sp.]
MDSSISNFDPKKISSMLQLMKQFSNNKSNTNVSKLPSLEIDKVVNSNEMNIIKSAIPYINYQSQKQLAVFVKLIELLNTVKLYNNYAVSEIPELNKINSSKQDMLYNIRSYCSPKNKQLIDFLLNIYNLKALIASMNKDDLDIENTHENCQDNNFKDNLHENTSTENLSQDDLINKLKDLMQG